MKYVLILSTLFTMSSFGKTVTVTGASARALLDIGFSLNLTERSMGKADLSIRNVHCEKLVTDRLSNARCKFVTVVGDIGKVKEIITGQLTKGPSSDAQEAQNLRVLLAEITGKEHNVSKTRKVVNASSISCHASGLGHWMDDLGIEEQYKCVVSF